MMLYIIKNGRMRQVPEAWELKWFCERLLYLVAGIAFGIIWRSFQG
jgi:hypothetical protein